MELTSAGELFSVEAGKIIHQYEESLSTINAFTGHSRKNISVTFLGEALRSRKTDRNGGEKKCKKILS